MSHVCSLARLDMGSCQCSSSVCQACVCICGVVLVCVCVSLHIKHLPSDAFRIVGAETVLWHVCLCVCMCVLLGSCAFCSLSVCHVFALHKHWHIHIRGASNSTIHMPSACLISATRELCTITITPYVHTRWQAKSA